MLDWLDVKSKHDGLKGKLKVLLVRSINNVN